MKTITIYSTPGCHYCHLAEDYFKKVEVPFELIDISESEELQTKVFEMTGKLNVPVIVIGEAISVGFSEKVVEKALHDEGYLK